MTAPAEIESAIEVALACVSCELAEVAEALAKITNHPAVHRQLQFIASSRRGPA